MSSFKEKAKTSYYICENAYLNCEKCKPQNKCGSGNCPLVNVLWVRLEDVKEKAIALYRYYYEKSERNHGCFALGELFGVNVLDEWWNAPIEPKKFEKLLKEASGNE